MYANRYFLLASANNPELFIVARGTVWLVCALLASMLMVIAYMLYRRYLTRQRTRTQELLIKEHQRTAQEVIHAEEKERKRIATHLHDDVVQVMSAAKMNLSAVQDELDFPTERQKQLFEKALNMVDDSCREARNISREMMPDALLNSGLTAAVRALLSRLPDPALKVQLTSDGLEGTLEKDIEIVLYRIVQECVLNVNRHALATRLDVSMIKDPDGTSITIEDNGLGFDIGRIGRFEGVGIANTLKRVEYLDGTIEWSSAAGKGTLVSVHIPAKRAAN